ncbi:hypothetical protein [Amycolatopsis rubida]|uniref:Uncharacterized protein n=1 Tax=Amycolatopsis rubida TaxID=112413 RepID=A0A1I5IJT2_9PSEU|nr:hypothetical protein [Amycolatopsis rubida]SFO60476.1 hypothetical protein SAMN05421854_102498 [Amycolatopsis rubida]
MTGRVFTAGDPEPPASEVRSVLGASGTVYARSEPAGLYWHPRYGVGLVRHWPRLLAHDGPLTVEVELPPLALFDLPGAS